MYIPNSYGTGKTFRGNRFNASEFEEALEKGRALYKVELAKARKVSEDLITAPMWTRTQATKYFGQSGLRHLRRDDSGEQRAR